MIPGSSPSGSARPPGSTAPVGAAAIVGRAAGLSGPARLRCLAHGRFFREPARRRPAFGPHAASRHRPAPGASQGRSSPSLSDAPAPATGGAAGFQPLKPGDYMSSAGTRPMTPRVGSVADLLAGPRRPGGDGGDGGRRESPAGRAGPCPSGRPRPQPPRAGGPPRPTSPGPLPKTQRPEKSMTREEMLALMRSGRLDALQSPGGGGPGPGGGTAPRPAATRRGAFPGRRPAAAPRPVRRSRAAPWPCVQDPVCQAPPPPIRRPKRKREKGKDRAAGLGRRSRRPPRPAQRARRRSPRHLAGPRRRTPGRRRRHAPDPLRQQESHAAASGSPSPPPANRTSRSNRRSPSAASPRRSGSRPTI